MLLFWKLWDEHSFRLGECVLTYALLCTSAVVVTLMDSVNIPLLPVNLLLIFFSFWCGMRRSFKNTLQQTLFSYLALLYLQCFLICLLPQDWIGTHRGNMTVNAVVLAVALVLSWLGRRYHWLTLYHENKGMVWVFLLVLCVPEIVLAQLFAFQMQSQISTTLLIAFLLQLLYMLSVACLFFVLKGRSERQQLAGTQKYIDEINTHLEESRKNTHDFNKHIRYLRNAVAVGSKDPELIRTVEDYCAELLGAYEGEEILLQLENPIFRALLFGRRTQAEKENISFLLDSTPLLPTFPMKNYQLVEVVDNLMDNAFECVAALPQEERWIRVALCTLPQPDGKTAHTFCIENPCRLLDFSAVIEGRSSTSKGGAHQGVGLKRVARTVALTGGKLILNTENEVFSAKILYETAD